MSRKRYVYTIDDDCFVATDPASGQPINVMAGHLRNLLTPSTPYFFNTMYDPYAPDRCAGSLLTWRIDSNISFF